MNKKCSYSNKKFKNLRLYVRFLNGYKHIKKRYFVVVQKNKTTEFPKFTQQRIYQNFINNQIKKKESKQDQYNNCINFWR